MPAPSELILGLPGIYIPQLTSPPNASGQRQWYLSTPSGMHVPPFWHGWESQGPTRETPIKSRDDRHGVQSTRLKVAPRLSAHTISRRAAKLSQLRKNLTPRRGARCSWRTLVRSVPIGSRVGLRCCASTVVSGYWLSLSKASEKVQRGPGLP